MTERAELATLQVDENVDVRGVQDFIDKALKDAAADLAEYGISAEPGAGPLIEAQQGEGQFGAVETIIIAVVGGVSQEVLKTIWNNVIWPALRGKFGGSVEQKQD